MKLFNHQKQAVHLAREGNVALFHQCGTGKTATALHIIKHYKAKGYGPALVVCPLSIIEAAWIEDAAKFTPELSIVSLWSKKPLERKKRLAEDHDIYVCNYETFKYLYNDICKKQFGVLIVDESSKMKNPRSQITKALLSMAGIKFRGSPFKADRPIPYRYCLSGTPAPNDESEYWSQIKFITGTGNKCFNDNFYAFRNRYFYSIDIGNRQKIFRFRKSMQREFMNQMSPVTHIIKKDDVLDLKEPVHQIRKVYLSKNEQAAYDEFEREAVLEFENEAVLSRIALTQVMKLRQLSSGFIYGQEETHQIGKSKLNELKALLEEIGSEQVIIWANFKEEIIELFKELKDSASLWGGSHDRDKTIRDFKNGNTQYLIANPMSAAHGLTFTNCSYAVYFSMNYSYEYQQQSQDRIHRFGQTEKCTYYYLVADKTIDEVIYKAINQKKELSDMVLNYLKEGSSTHGRMPKKLQTA